MVGLKKLTEDQAAQSKDSLPILKIVLVCGVAISLVGGLLVWMGNNASSKEADTLYAKAKDACNNNELISCITKVDEALTLQEKPDYLELKFNALMSQDKPYESRLVLEKLIHDKPDNAQYYFLLKGFQENERQIDQAFQSIDKAISLAPTNLDYQIAKATLLYNQDRQPEAVPIYEHVLQTDPKPYLYWDQYALSYSNNSHFNEALKIRLKGLAQFPKSSDHYFGLGQLYDQMGKKSEAVASYRRSLELEPLSDSIAAQRIFEITGHRVPPALENIQTDSIPLDTRGSVLFLSANINGVSGRFLLDTGASFCSIPANKAARFHLTPQQQVLGLQTANGMIQAPIAYGNLRIGRQDNETTRFAIIPNMKDDSVDGIIGMNFLQDFKFEINRAAARLTLHR